MDIIVPPPAPGGAIAVIIIQLLTALKENLFVVGTCDALRPELEGTRLTVMVPPFNAPEFILIPNCILVYSKGVIPVCKR